MQQLQHPVLQRAAWQRNTTTLRLVHAKQDLQHAVAHSRFLNIPLPASSGASASASRSRHSIISSCAAGDAASGSGDIVRPSAKASAPPTPAIDVTTGTAGASSSSSSGAGGASGGGTPSASGSSSARAYSELYKTLYSSSYPGAAGSSSSSKPSSSSRGSASSAGSSAAAAGSQHQQQHLQHGGSEPTTDASGSAPTTSSSSSDTTSISNGHGAGVGASSGAAAAAQAAAGVEEAIKKAQQALAAAESSLSSIHKLRSAQPRNNWHSLLQLSKTIATAVAAGALLVASHAFGLGWQWAGATLGALGLAAHAYQRSMVTVAGAAAAAAALLATLGCSMRFGLVMLVFAYSSSKLRKFKEVQLPIDLQAGSQAKASQARDWPEVACIALAPTIVAIAYGAMAGCLDLPLGTLPAVEPLRADLLTVLQGAVLGWYACCSGDTWSTELGSLSRDQPRLLTTLKPVRHGTHGGVTLLGLSGAAAGGLLVGLVFYCAAVLSPTLWVFETQRQAAMAQWRLIPLGLIAGLAGSLLDSLIGAALQFTGYDSAMGRLTGTPGPGVQRISGLQQTLIGDNVVNVLSAGITAALTALAALFMFG